MLIIYNLSVGFFDSMSRDKNGSRIDERIGMGSVGEIYNYREKIVNSLRVYLKQKG